MMELKTTRPPEARGIRNPNNRKGAIDVEIYKPLFIVVYSISTKMVEDS
jgi:hypothetical protein